MCVCVCVCVCVGKVPQVDVSDECGVELTTLKLSWFNSVHYGEYEALMAFNVVSSYCYTLLLLTAFEVSAFSVRSTD